MKQEQLKKLAKWGGVRLMTLEDETLAVAIPFQVNDLEGNLPHKLWQPHVDSNQLDMLEDKMIKETDVARIEITLRFGGYYVAQYWDEKRIGEPFHFESDLITSGKGKTKNEARFNAILNYIESK